MLRTVRDSEHASHMEKSEKAYLILIENLQDNLGLEYNKHTV
jgi:hypothetical protein